MRMWPASGDSENSTSGDDMSADDFVPFPKIARLSRDVVVSEKIDGTNACIQWSDDMAVMRTGSRTRWITPEDDNFGFAMWAHEHKAELEELGPGTHFGEWWGCGIQRNYGLKEKRFSLFNTHRWKDATPKCCHVVPVLYTGPFDTVVIDSSLADLAANGSWAVKGFAKPEGVVIFHTASQTLFKKTVDRDGEPKGKVV